MCPYLGGMSNEEIRALDKDLEESRNAFLLARETQSRLNSNTHDVNHRPKAPSRTNLDKQVAHPRQERHAHVILAKMPRPPPSERAKTFPARP